MGERSDQQRCGGCVHYSPDAYVEETGVCRRYAPKPSPLPISNGDGISNVGWPVVDPMVDFCGEFNPRKIAGARQHG